MQSMEVILPNVSEFPIHNGLNDFDSPSGREGRSRNRAPESKEPPSCSIAELIRLSTINLYTHQRSIDLSVTTTPHN